jgi:transitional endoplasmic reticulum ATPase
MSIDKATILRLLKKEPPKVEFTHVEVIRDSQTGKIVLPEGMSYDDAVIWLRKKKKEEETEVQFMREFPFHPHDGAVALANVLKSLFGWRELVPEKTWFGEILPTFLSIKTGVNEQVSVPWGQMAIPGVTGVIKTAAKGGYNAETEEWTPEQFVMTGKIWQRDVLVLDFIADEITKWVSDHSIYRKKAIDSKRDFLDLSKVKQDDLIFGPETLAQIETSIFTPIAHSALCREAGVPGKRGILLQGPYGTGKTLTAYVTAKLAVANGMTFVYGHTDDDIAQVIHLARQYQPSVVFMEDVDTKIGDTDEDQSEILDVMDGILSKDSEVIAIFTTNHPEDLPKALRRPGRLDAVIHVGPPEPAAVERLIRKYSRGLIPAAQDISGAVRACKGMIPATIREMVERAKLTSINRTKSKEFEITNEDLIFTIGMMRGQLAYMQADRPVQKMVKLLAEYPLAPGAEMPKGELTPSEEAAQK